MNFTRADFALHGTQCAEYIRARFYDVRTAACHKYRGVASLQIASVCASFYNGGAFPHIFDWIRDTRNILSFEKLPPPPRIGKERPRHVVFSPIFSRRSYAEIQNLIFLYSRRVNRGLKSTPHHFVFSDYIFFFTCSFCVILYFLLVPKSPSITPLM